MDVIGPARGAGGLPGPEPLGAAPAHLPLARATVSDVARLAGVSGKTVSRVMAGEAYVSEQTRGRVLEAARRLRFRPNHLARDLRRGGASTAVAFVMGEMGNPFYARVAAGIERALSEHGLTMVVAATGDDPAQEEKVVAAMLERRVRSLLLVPVAADQSYLEGERQLGTPVVCIDRPAHHLAADSVVFANHDGARTAVASLLAHGHRRIAFVGGRSHLHTQGRRLAGYRQALVDAGVPGHAEYERTDGSDATTAERAVRDLLALPTPPTAIFAGNNQASTGILHALRAGGRRLALVGFDDFDLADLLGITVVAHDPEEMGRRAVALALAAEAGAGGPAQVELPTRLIRRGSGELPPPPD